MLRTSEGRALQTGGGLFPRCRGFTRLHEEKLNINIYRKSLRICAAEHLSIDRVYGVEHFDGNWNHHAWSMSEATERTVSSGTRPTVSSTPLPSALLATWSEQIATHGGSRPVWLDARLLKSGTLVADSLSCGVPTRLRNATRLF